jgi:hypothetical protein
MQGSLVQPPPLLIPGPSLGKEAGRREELAAALLSMAEGPHAEAPPFLHARASAEDLQRAQQPQPPPPPPLLLQQQQQLWGGGGAVEGGLGNPPRPAKPGSVIVSLNVGGHRFSTTLATLAVVEGSYLHRLASQAQGGGANPHFFIDRSGKVCAGVCVGRWVGG